MTLESFDLNLLSHTSTTAQDVTEDTLPSQPAIAHKTPNGHPTETTETTTNTRIFQTQPTATRPSANLPEQTGGKL